MDSLSKAGCRLLETQASRATTSSRVSLSHSHNPTASNVRSRITSNSNNSSRISSKASNSVTYSRIRRGKILSETRAKAKARGNRSRMVTGGASLRWDNPQTIVAWEEMPPRARIRHNNGRKASRPEVIGANRRPRIPVSSLVRVVRDPLLVGPLTSREWKVVA